MQTIIETCEISGVDSLSLRHFFAASGKCLLHDRKLTKLTSIGSAVTPSGTGVKLLIQVQPGARKTELVAVHSDRLKIRIAAPPVEGKANIALVDFIADLLGVSRRQVEVVSGLSARQKTVLISGVSVSDVLQPLETVLTVRG